MAREGVGNRFRSLLSGQQPEARAAAGAPRTGGDLVPAHRAPRGRSLWGLPALKEPVWGGMLHPAPSLPGPAGVLAHSLPLPS